jgi:hypothetical protein
MAVLTLPKASKATVVTCIAMQAFALYAVATHPHRSLWLSVIAFFAAGFLTDFISGLAHFGFDYIWPPHTPILGPIAVEFRHHHESPTLDPSAVVTNLTKGAYCALPFAIITKVATMVLPDTAGSFLGVAILMGTSLWMLGFHQIHSYAHMGSRLSPEEFNQAVAEISKLPTRRQQEAEFAKFFQSLGIPRSVRLLQHCRLFLRPEIHWQHHISFETDFSSVNGWSDPLMNGLYRRLVRRKRARSQTFLVSNSTPSQREAS